MLCCVVLDWTGFCCVVLRCVALRYAVLYCVVFHCIVFYDPIDRSVVTKPSSHSRNPVNLYHKQILSGFVPTHRNILCLSALFIMLNVFGHLHYLQTKIFVYLVQGHLHLHGFHLKLDRREMLSFNSGGHQLVNFPLAGISLCFAYALLELTVAALLVATARLTCGFYRITRHKDGL